MICPDYLAELEDRMLEAVRVFDHPSCILTVLLARPVICDFTTCSQIATAAVNAQPLCPDHGAARVSRLCFDAQIRALVDVVRSHGWLEPDGEGRAA